MCFEKKSKRHIRKEHKISNSAFARLSEKIRFQEKKKKMAAVETATSPELRETLIDTFSFRRNRVSYSIFYTASAATVVMFIVLCTLSGWSVSIGNEINGLVTTGHETLKDVQDLLPDAREALRILKAMCRHENFTKTWGGLCE